MQRASSYIVFFQHFVIKNGQITFLLPQQISQNQTTFLKAIYLTKLKGSTLIILTSFLSKFRFEIRKIMQLLQNHNKQQQMNRNHTITIGYYNLRGKAQVCRLLCQYLKVDYEDKFFSLQQWDKFKKEKTKKWTFSDLPFLQQGDFVVTQPTPMCLYVISRFGTPDLLGKNLIDRSIVDQYVWTIQTMGGVIAINCQKMAPEQLQALKQKQWNENVYSRLKKYEQYAKENSFFLGYLTLIDFSVYELVRYMQMIFPGKMQKFPKLLAIRQMVYEIPEIKAYQRSQRCVVDMCPSKLLDELKKRQSQQKIKQSTQ